MMPSSQPFSNTTSIVRFLDLETDANTLGSLSDAMEDNEDETEEEEGNKILQEVLDDIGINLSQRVRLYLLPIYSNLMRYSNSWA